MSNWTEQDVKEALDKVMAKAAEDKAFRELAESNPAKAIEEAAGKALPDGVKIQFFDPGDAHLAYVLPPFKGIGELAEEDLEAVAGGAGGDGKQLNGWKCPGCSNINFEAMQKCFKCGRAKS